MGGGGGGRSEEDEAVAVSVEVVVVEDVMSSDVDSGATPNAPTFQAGLKYLSEDEYAWGGRSGAAALSSPSLPPSPAVIAPSTALVPSMAALDGLSSEDCPAEVMLMDGEEGAGLVDDFLFEPRVSIDHRLNTPRGLSSDRGSEVDNDRRTSGRVDELATEEEIELKADDRANINRAAGVAILTATDAEPIRTRRARDENGVGREGERAAGRWRAGGRLRRRREGGRDVELGKVPARPASPELTRPVVLLPCPGNRLHAIALDELAVETVWTCGGRGKV